MLVVEMGNLTMIRIDETSGGIAFCLLELVDLEPGDVGEAVDSIDDARRSTNPVDEEVVNVVRIGPGVDSVDDEPSILLLECQSVAPLFRVAMATASREKLTVVVIAKTEGPFHLDPCPGDL
ncbi:hypothetical protein D7X32_23560 [Corallococcus carmarthensis]|uniref:Uncharacterized protein n=1 Tax=Corallococcus carmarthensis TaxID=2316728 RepID=A0A3A8JWU5_9BACT|nr:hypothetical protein D7X32_23560 [Corallococcus carmarthensis]